jgi:hypothetical protein
MVASWVLAVAQVVVPGCLQLALLSLLAVMTGGLMVRTEGPEIQLGCYGSAYRRSRDAGDSFGARDEMLVAVVNNVGNVTVDVSCAGVVSDDVAGDRDRDGLVGVSLVWCRRRW